MAGSEYHGPCHGQPTFPSWSTRDAQPRSMLEAGKKAALVEGKVPQRCRALATEIISIYCQ